MPYIAQTIYFARSGDVFTWWFALSVAISVSLARGCWQAWIYRCDQAYVRKTYRKRGAAPSAHPAASRMDHTPAQRGIVPSWFSEDDAPGR